MNCLALACRDAAFLRPADGAWWFVVTDEPSEASPCEDGPERLILAIAARADRAAFTSLFLHFAPRVKAYLLRRGLSGPVAEELAQEAMLTVWRRAAQFDPARAGAAAWIFAIARNLCIDAARR